MDRSIDRWIDSVIGYCKCVFVFVTEFVLPVHMATADSETSRGSENVKPDDDGGEPKQENVVTTPATDVLAAGSPLSHPNSKS